MTAIKLVSVLCACGWQGTLSSCGDCPSCGAGDGGRMTPARIAILRAFARGEQPKIPTVTRRWLRDHRLIAAGPAITPSAARRRTPPKRAFRLTEHGERVLSAAGDAS